jgi:prevent-host-death family protein
MEVPVRELKARLSSYLRRAAGGERITVTDRGRPVAVLGPVPGQVDLAVGVAEGWLVPPRAPSGLAPVARHRADRSVADVLADDRDR